MKEFAVIMAGGSGSRFWPVSRNSTPKQYLNLFGKKTLIQTAFERNSRVFGKNNVFICTNPLQEKIVSEQLQIRKEKIILEPFPRDTAAAIGLSVVSIMEKGENAIIAVLPSDHLVNDAEAYGKTLRKAVEIAKNSDDIVTVGVPPTYASTALGYIETGEKISGGAWKVKMFREKPGRETAEEYVASGKFFWNAGMFVFRAKVMLDAIKKFMPGHFKALEKIRQSGFDRRMIEKEFSEIEKTSIDYGVMEKAGNVSVVKAEFGWDDVGSWNALERIIAVDSEKNAVKGLSAKIDSSGNIVFSDSGIVGCIGVKDMVVIKTSDAVLVCRKSDVEKVKELVKELEKNKETKGFI